MNKEIIIESFENILIELSSINEVYSNKKSSKEALKNALAKADDIIFFNHNNFNVFYEGVNVYICAGYKPYAQNIESKELFSPDPNKKLPKIQVKAIYNQLILLISSFKLSNLIDYKAAINRDNQLGEEGVVLSSITALSKDIKEKHKSLNINSLTKTDLRITLDQYIKEIIILINSVLLNDIYRIFEERKINEKALPKIFRYNPKPKEAYIQKWIACTVTVEEVNRFKNVNYWEEIMECGLDDDKIQNIEIHQKKIFLKAVKLEVQKKIKLLDALPNKLIIVEQNIKLIEKYFSGDYKKEDEARLSNILKIYDSEKVLLAYDNILNEKLPIDKFIIFNSENGDYTPVFVTAFFMLYLNNLKAILSLNFNPKNEKGNKSTSSNIKSFKYKRFNENPAAITNLMDSLVKNDFIDKSAKLSDFRQVFSGKEIETKIVWNGKEYLVYFVKQMKKLKLIKPVKAIWQITAKCFVDSNGNDFDPENLRGQKNPAETSKIDKIINNLKRDSA